MIVSLFLVCLVYCNGKAATVQVLWIRLRSHKSLLNRRKFAMKRRQVFFSRQLQEWITFCAVLLRLNHFITTSFRVPKLVWVRERSSHWWDHVEANFTPQDWLDNFRSSRSTFTCLCDTLRPDLSTQDIILHRAITVEKSGHYSLVSRHW